MGLGAEAVKARLRRALSLFALARRVYVMREYLQAILEISEDPHARALAAAALIETRARP
jgi:hypothetical protein